MKVIDRFYDGRVPSRNLMFAVTGMGKGMVSRYNGKIKIVYKYSDVKGGATSTRTMNNAIAFLQSLVKGLK